MSRFETVSPRRSRYRALFSMTSSRGALFAFRHQTNDYNHRKKRLVEPQLTTGREPAVVLVLLGGTTWLGGGIWAPDGVYSRFVSPAIGLVGGMVVSGVLLTRSPATRTGW